MFNIGVHIGGYAGTYNDEDGRHETWVETFSVAASSPRGDTWVLIGSDTKDAAEAQDFLTFFPGTPETHPDLWMPSTPIYGSEAWGPEAEYELACFEADAYGEPRPQW